MTNKRVIIYSGGMDSFTLLNLYLSRGIEVQALSFDYGQKHKKELRFAKNVCEDLKVPHKIIDLSSINQLFGKSALTSDIDVPNGHYTDSSMRITIVPNRNMILLALAMGYAISINFNTVGYAAHSGDSTVYPDCRPLFVDRLRYLAEVIDYNRIYIDAPFLHYSKAEILSKGIELKLDYSKTWSCYKGGAKACGRCGTCVEGLEAVAMNEVRDPINYEEDVYGD